MKSLSKEAIFEKIPGLYIILSRNAIRSQRQDMDAILDNLKAICNDIFIEKGVLEPNLKGVNLPTLRRLRNLKSLLSLPANYIIIVHDLKSFNTDIIINLLDSHKKSQRLMSVFSPGFNSNTHIMRPLVELFSVGPCREFLRSLRWTARLCNGMEFVVNWTSLREHLVKLRLPHRFKKLLRRLNYRYQYWQNNSKSLFISGLSEENELLAMNVDDNTLGMQLYPLIPSSQVNVYTGNKSEIKNYFIDRIEEFYPFPKVIFLVLSNRCNLKCIMCPFHSPKAVPFRRTDFFKERRVLDFSLIERVAKEAGINGASFHIGELDEPALHPRLPDIVSIAKHNSVVVHITTNGLLFKPNLSEAIIRAGLDSISFSIDAASEKTYKRIRGGNFNTLVQNITEFIRLRDKYRPSLTINACMILQDGAIDESQQFLEFWRAKGVDSVSNYQLYDMDELNGTFQVNHHAKFYQSHRTPCPLLWTNCFIYPGGDVSLCCTTNGWVTRLPMSELRTGNITHTTLKEIWSGPRYQQIRIAYLEGNWNEVPYCKDCDMWAAMSIKKRFIDKNTIISYNENEAWYKFVS